jgi:hypothetical protein
MIHLANREPDSEADKLYARIEERCRMGIAAHPVDESLVCILANTLIQRAEMRPAEAGNEFLAQAGRLVETALQAHPEHEGLLSAWARVLNFRTLRMPGDETNRLIDAAVRQLNAAQQSGAAPGSMLWRWGVLLWTQARRSEGPDSIQLLEEAKRKFLELESRSPRSVAYNLACVCALLGDREGCRHWLQHSLEPGILVSSDWMARDPALASVRDCDWFRQMLAV